MMKGLKRVYKGFLFLLLAGLMTGAATLPLSAQYTIPAGSTIDEAVFSIYKFSYWPNSFYLQMITTDWNEETVTWNSFHPNFHPYIWAEFVALEGVTGWYSVSIKDLVRGWVNGDYPNFGFVMRQRNTSSTAEGSPILTHFHSSEYIDETSYRPKLEIKFTPPGGTQQSIVIQRPDPAVPTVYDAFIYEIKPDAFYNWVRLDTALYYSSLYEKIVEKYSLIRFHFDVEPPSNGPGTGTPGYWMNHPDAWPVDSIMIGGVNYTKEQAIAIMQMPVAGDMTYVMFMALVAAKLNVMIGNDSSCIADTIAAADAWMTTYPLGSPVFAGGRTSPWRVGEPLYMKLDDYNNGLLCAPSRDSLEY